MTRPPLGTDLVTADGQVSEYADQPGEVSADAIGVSGSEGGGTRTHDLGIKSPLLYQLSYAPERFKDNVAAWSWGVGGLLF